jgi:hypothetical protein
MVCRTEDDELVGIVLAAFRAELDVVQIDEDSVPAARHDAASCVAGHHEPPDGGWDRLRGLRSRFARVGIGVGDRHKLRVAGCHLEDFAAHVDELTLGLLPSSSTLFALVQQDLVARSSIIPRPAEHLPRHEQERCVIVERLARIATEPRQRFVERRSRFSRSLEAQHLAADLRIGGIIGAVAEAVARDELLDSRTVRFRADSTQSPSVLAVATRVSSRTADQEKTPSRRACDSSGRLSSASATRSLSLVKRGE